MNTSETLVHIRTSLSDRITRLHKLTKLQIKSIFSSGIVLAMVFALPVILLMGIGAMVRESNVFIPAFGISQIIIIGVMYSHLYYSTNKNVLSENLSLSKVTSWQRFISISIAIFIFAFASYLLELALFVSLESLHLLFMLGFVFEGDDGTYSYDLIWSDAGWSGIFIYFLETFILTIAIYTIVAKLAKDKKSFTVFVFCYMIVFLCLGGIMTSDYQYYNTETGELISRKYRALANEQNIPAAEINYNQTSDWHFADWVDWFSFFNPQWYVNQHFFFAPAFGSIGTEGNDIITDEVPGLLTMAPAHFQAMYWSKIDQFWNYSMIAPFAYTVLLLIIAKLIKSR